MKDFIYLTIVFFGTLVLMHLYLIWACWMICVAPTVVVFVVDFLTAIVLTLFAGFIKANPL